MPELKNERHETFARLVADGLGKTWAYHQVYGAASHLTAKSEGTVVSQRPEVAARIAELQVEGAQEAIWALEERLEYLRDVAMMPYGMVTDESAHCQAKRLKTQGVEFHTPDKLAAV